MEPDLVVSCPYNPAHRIRQYKLMNHIAKCKRSNSTGNKVECPLDKSHIVDKEQLREHIALCSSLGKLVGDTDRRCTEQETDTASAIIEPYRATEHWEQEPEVPSYDPMEASAKKEVIRCISGLSKSEKKKFRDSERMRIANLKGINTTRTNIDISFSEDTVHEVPLRPPHSTVGTLCNAKITQNDFGGNKCIHNIRTQVKPSHKFDHDSFRKKLYDETASRCDDVSQQLEHSVYSADVSFDKSLNVQGACSRGYQHISKEKDLSISKEEDIKVKSEVDVTFDNVDNLEKEKSKCSVDTSKVPGRVADKLLTLLKNSDFRKVEPVEEMKYNDKLNEKSGEKEYTWEDDFNQFNDRLAYLTDIQNTAAEESALLLQQLKELKLRRDTTPRK